MKQPSPRQRDALALVADAGYSVSGVDLTATVAAAAEIEKWAFRGVYPQTSQTSSPNFSNVSRPIFVFMYLHGCDKDENKV